MNKKKDNLLDNVKIKHIEKSKIDMRSKDIKRSSLRVGSAISEISTRPLQMLYFSINVFFSETRKMKNIIIPEHFSYYFYQLSLGVHLHVYIFCELSVS